MCPLPLGPCLDALHLQRRIGVDKRRDPEAVHLFHDGVLHVLVVQHALQARTTQTHFEGACPLGQQRGRCVRPVFKRQGLKIGGVAVARARLGEQRKLGAQCFRDSDPGQPFCRMEWGAVRGVRRRAFCRPGPCRCRDAGFHAPPVVVTHGHCRGPLRLPTLHSQVVPLRTQFGQLRVVPKSKSALVEGRHGAPFGLKVPRGTLDSRPPLADAQAGTRT